VIGIFKTRNVPLGYAFKLINFSIGFRDSKECLNSHNAGVRQDDTNYFSAD